MLLLPVPEAVLLLPVPEAVLLLPVTEAVLLLQSTRSTSPVHELTCTDWSQRDLGHKIHLTPLNMLLSFFLNF